MTSSPIRACFQEFYDADEVEPVLTSFSALLEAAGAKEAIGLSVFSTLESVVAPALNFRQKSIFPLLRHEIQKREELVVSMKSSSSESSSDIVISGAGPCGLRAAVESALCGMRVSCIEKRDKFSRVNILTLYPQTHADLIALGLKYFYPTHPVVGDPVLALGTRQIQLVLLKTACMLGVRVFYAACLQSLIPPSEAGTRWQALVTRAGSVGSGPGAVAEGLKHSAQSTLDFKQNKVQRAGYQATSKCNAVEITSVDEGFVSGSNPDSAEEVSRVPFDGLVVAEGEWSTATRALGFDKTIDKFSLALGLVLNLKYNPRNKAEKECKARIEMGTDLLDENSVGRQLQSQHGIEIETLDYLKGQTHFIAVCISKNSLLNYGALRSANAPGGLLSPDNLDMERLRRLSSTIAGACGLPASTEWAEHNPTQLFDFSSRSRCLRPCKILSSHLAPQPSAAVLECSREAAAHCARGEGKAALVLPVGDSLLEPFWPQGLGMNRGMHTALNGVFAVLAAQHCGLQAAVAEARWGFACTMQATWTPAYVTPCAGWTADPLSRFSPQILLNTKQTVLAGAGKRMCADQDLPLRVLHHMGPRSAARCARGVDEADRTEDRGRAVSLRVEVA